MRLRVLLLLVMICVSSCGYAQVDSEYWFAPPEVTSGHGDRPVYLRISTLDKASLVTVTQPARGNIQLASVMIAANATQTINLTSQIDFLETIIPGAVMRTGLRIVATNPITAYYEVGAPFNSDIFVLKGKNALGNRFMIPGQDLYNNGSNYSPSPYSSFDIVATQNNTVVKVKPTRAITGHVGKTEIVIKLNAGETYSFRKTTLLAADNPIGTLVESNKPIAITIKDDSVINGTCRDLLGDQLVPLEVAGSEYIVLKGFVSTSEFVFITATENSTKIYIDGAPTPAASLNAGQVYRHPVQNKSMYVYSDKVIYVFHATGFGCEIGLAILPSINCKGSTQIGFSRTTDEFFGLNVMVRKEGIASFKLNGSSSAVPSFMFTPVPGTNDKWYAAQLSFSTAQIPVGQGSLLTNEKNSFQAGIVNGNATSTCRYGYFSSFSTLFIGDDFNICENETAVIDAGTGKESYLWNTGSTAQKIEVKDPGMYTVRATREDCILYDTVVVGVKKGALYLGADVRICKGDTAKIDGKENFSWKWSTGSQDQFLRTTKPGKYWLSVFDYNGCAASDTINIMMKDGPLVDLGPALSKCTKEQVQLNATFPGATYLWDNGSTTATRIVTSAGTYWCKAFFNGCRDVDSVTVIQLPEPEQNVITGSPSVCPFVEQVEYAVDSIDFYTYKWFVNGGLVHHQEGSKVFVNWNGANAAATVKSVVTHTNGCRGDTLVFNVKVNVKLEPELPDGPDTLCLNKGTGVVYSTPLTNGSVYQWNISGGEIISGQGKASVGIDWREGMNELWIEESSVTPGEFCSGTSPKLSVFVFKDRSAVQLNFVTVDTVSEGSIRLAWSVAESSSIMNDQTSVYKRAIGATQWDVRAMVSGAEQSFHDSENATGDYAFEYYVGFTNGCYEDVSSQVNSTVLLGGVSETESDFITLNWTAYEGWEDGVDRYEIWRSMEGENYKMLTSLPGDKNDFSSKLAADGFIHRYRIRAIQKNGTHASWSNSIGFEFDHPVFVPNVFTPNGDPYNPFFEILKIGLYPDSKLMIMDRWGKKVHEAIGYQNNWDARELSTGVYYVFLHLHRNNIVLKSTLHIIR